MMYQYRFINCHKCPTLVGDVGSGNGCACVGQRATGELSVLCSQFCCEPKMALKSKICSLKKMIPICLKFFLQKVD